MQHRKHTNITATVTALLFGLLTGNAAARDDSSWDRPMPVTEVRATATELKVIAPLPAARRTTPDLGAFDSVAISSRNLPAATKWRSVKAPATSALALCGTDAACGPLAIALRRAAEHASDQAPVARLRTINSAVNQALTYGSDRTVWGTGDYWATPAEILARGRGDCEDYAILKYWLLRDAGFTTDQLQLIVLRDTRRNVYHAVLAVHLGGARYVLDNLSESVRTDRSFASYMPIMSFVGDKSYVHGFRNKRAEVASMPSNYADIAPGEGN